jgi:hypothetical protein
MTAGPAQENAQWVSGPRWASIGSKEWSVRLAMNVRTRNKPSAAFSACLAICLFVLPVDFSWAATTIYKCFSLLYTDEPCKDGEQLNIRAGDADPVAVARLERERDALEQSAARRTAETRRDTDLAYVPVEEGGSYDQGPAYVSAYGFGSSPFMQHHPMRPRQPKAHHMRHQARHPPFIVPRR